MDSVRRLQLRGQGSQGAGRSPEREQQRSGGSQRPLTARTLTSPTMATAPLIRAGLTGDRCGLLVLLSDGVDGIHRLCVHDADDVAVKVREVIRILEEDGWQLVRQSGSHRQYQHPDRPGTVTVSGKLGADVPSGTLASIKRQAGLRGRQ